jgi:serum/glucocorticoid-regulated kinase 2
MSSMLKDLILKLLDKNPETRLGSKGDAREVLAHPYFAGIEIDKLLRREYKAPYAPKQSVLTL